MSPIGRKTLIDCKNLNRLLVFTLTWAWRHLQNAHEGHRPSRFRRILITVLFLVIVIGIAAVSRLQFSSVSQTTQTTQTAIPFAASNPIILNGKANVTYPASYGILANYSLKLINKNRAANGLPPLSLSNISSAQQHADSEMYFGYFSHWDTQGYKPYMRYTLLGGSGAVSENIGLNFCQDSRSYLEPCTIQTIENGINDSEWSMLNNDTICCNNDHKADILDPFHNRVSIGIAWNATSSRIYFVEDFENSYFVTSKFSYSSSVVSIQTSQATALELNTSVNILEIHYDPLPQPIAVGFNPTYPELESDCSNWTNCPGYSSCGTVNELTEIKPCEYWGSYGPGQLAGYLFTPCPIGYSCPNVTTNRSVALYANNWQYSSKQLSATFSLTGLTMKYGNGVYTLYLYDERNNMWLSLSIFVNSWGWLRKQEIQIIGTSSWLRVVSVCVWWCAPP